MSNRWLVIALVLIGACNMSTVTFIKEADDGGDPLPEFLSCATLAATCGPADTNDSCCNSPEVIGEIMYYRSYDVANDGNSGSTSAPATVNSFRLDKYELTVGRFRTFVNAGKGTQASPPESGAGGHAEITGSGWDATWNSSLVADTPTLKANLKCNSMYQTLTWTDAPGANENRPVSCISWYEAMAFCAWDGGFLPTEAEWNYAAAGGEQQRAYPWSNPPGTLTTLDGSHTSYNCIGDNVAGCAVTDLVVVGSKSAGDGRWGQSDLAGNVWEWTLDWYAAYQSECTNCANLVNTSNRVIRGGSFNLDAPLLRTGNRYFYYPTSRSHNIGVRCARIP